MLVVGSGYLFVPAVFDRASWGLLLGIGLVGGWLWPATSHVLRTRSIKGPERWRARQRIEILVEMPATKALERCTEAVKRIPHCRNVRPRAGEAIEARIRVLGERVSCRVIAVDERHTRVLVSSQPVWPTEVFDDGRNWANVVAIREALASGFPPTRRRSREDPGPRARSPRRSFRPRQTARTSIS